MLYKHQNKQLNHPLFSKIPKVCKYSTRLSKLIYSLLASVFDMDLHILVHPQEPWPILVVVKFPSGDTKRIHVCFMEILHWCPTAFSVWSFSTLHTTSMLMTLVFYFHPSETHVSAWISACLADISSCIVAHHQSLNPRETEHIPEDPCIKILWSPWRTDIKLSYHIISYYLAMQVTLCCQPNVLSFLFLLLFPSPRDPHVLFSPLW